MEVALSVSNSRDLCCGWKQLGSVIVFRDARRYQNSLLERMRLSNFVLGISKLCSRWRHGFAEKPCVEVHSYTPLHVCGRPRLLSKVSALAGFDGFDDLTEKAKEEKLFDEHIKDAMDDFDLALACKRFPSISLGSSPPIELYDDTCDSSKTKSPLVMKDYEGFLRDLVNKWVDPDSLSEEWPSDNSSLGPLLQEEDQNACTTSDLVEKETHTSDELREDDSAHWTSLPDGVFLDSPLSCIPRLTKRQCRLLENSGFHTVRKLLNHFPRTYADMQNAHVGIDDGQYLISVGEVLSSRGVRASSSFSFLEVVVGCEIADHETQEMADDVDTKRKKTIHLHLKKFFRGVRFATAGFLRCLQGKFNVGDVVCVSGKVRTMRTKNHYEMREYHIDVIKDDKELSLHTEARPFSIYPSKGGSNPDFLRNMIVSVVKVLPAGIDPIPEAICQEFGLLSLHHAYVGIHQPKHVEEADLARKRLIFDEFFYLQLARLFQMLEGLGTHMEKDGLLDKYRKPELNSAYIEDWSTLTKKFLKALPYSLTPGQLRAVSEIIWDLKQPVPMNRLLQGDVGCGKTIVAFLACMEVIGSGYQVAFMVPTELLAIQHYEHMLGLLERMEEDDSKPTVALLTGSTPSKQSRVIRQDLQAGNISMVIGTHSLISDNIEFSALRIAVVDEQHRFGVIQRGRFNSKLYFSSQISKSTEANSDGPSKVMAPHVLAMSATPIPRTLALALYGDMSLTQITDLPPGRIPVETCVIEGNDEGFEGVYKMMLDELEDGGRVYIVYPVIEQSEQLPQLRAASADLDEVSDRFQDYNCGLLHGKMKGDEKDEALKQFRSGKTHILLSTQVIEIGVDVPDASMMVVMNAERFGIAQLHQLRGRVGRGTRKSKCILVASTASSLSRLRVLEKSSDGFHLANTDLLLRGPGDLLGKKQSGHLPEFPIARLEIDGNILQDAHAAALKILGDSHDLEKYPSLKVELSMRQPLCLLGD